MTPYRSPMASLLSFASQRDKDATSLGDIISQLAKPVLGDMGVKTSDIPAPTNVGAGRVDMESIKDPLFRKMVQQESGGQIDAISPKGAAGPAQVMPATARDPGYGVKNIFDRADAANIPYTSRSDAEATRLLTSPTSYQLGLDLGNDYKTAMEAQFGGDPRLTAAAYNAGPGAVRAAGNKVPNFAETQNYVQNTAGGAPGQLPQNIEGLLSQLYPQPGEDEATARRKNKMLGLSQIFSSLASNAPVDVSNVVANNQQRQRQSLLDMRERERARGAASLVLAQTGDSAMASAIASGSISYADVVTERERKRIEDKADTDRVKAEQAAGRLGDVFKGLDPIDLGLTADAFNTAVEGIKAGDDPSKYLDLGQITKVAEATRKAENARADTLEQLRASQKPEDQRAAFLMDMDPTLSLKDAITTASAGDKQYAAQAEIKDYMRIFGVDEITAYKAIQAQNAAKASSSAPQVNIGISPDGKLVANPATTATAPVTGATGDTTGAAAGAAAAAPTISELGKTSEGTATVTDPITGQVSNVPVPGAITPKQAATDLTLTEEQVAEKQLANQAKRAELEAARVKAAAVNTRVVDQAVKDQALLADALDMLDDPTATGMVGGIIKKARGLVGVGSPQSELYATIASAIASRTLDTLSKLETPLTPVSDNDVGMAAAVDSVLADPSLLGTEALRAGVIQASNMNAELTFGASEPERLDENGVPYTTTARTLGMTDDRFAKNWQMLPANVRQQWADGKITVFPTGEDVPYSNTSDFINKKVAEFEAYRGDIADRTIVGASKSAEEAAAPTVTIGGEPVKLSKERVLTLTPTELENMSAAEKTAVMDYMNTLR